MDSSVSLRLPEVQFFRLISIYREENECMYFTAELGTNKYFKNILTEHYTNTCYFFIPFKFHLIQILSPNLENRCYLQSAIARSRAATARLA